MWHKKSHLCVLLLAATVKQEYNLYLSSYQLTLLNSGSDSGNNSKTLDNCTVSLYILFH
jgi:hypothetical protein